MTDISNLQNDNMVHVVQDGIEYIKFNHFSKYDNILKHCYTTRRGGISTGEFSSLNLARNSEDPIQNRDENYKRICGTLGIDNKRLIFSKQVHGTDIVVIDNENVEKFIDNNSYECDGFVTNQRAVPLVTIYADCVPIYLFDPMKKVIGLVHSGWRGTLSKIAAKAVGLLTDVYSCNPKDVLAGIGPSIGKCCFEVGNDTADLFINAFQGHDDLIFPGKQSVGKYNIDLWECNRQMLIDSGIQPANIEIAQICTVCNHQLFFSYRASDGSSARNVAIMQLI